MSSSLHTNEREKMQQIPKDLKRHALIAYLRIRKSKNPLSVTEIQQPKNNKRSKKLSYPRAVKVITALQTAGLIEAKVISGRTVYARTT